jgi:hypothetical protein
MSVKDVSSANDLLRFGIGVCQGEHGWRIACHRKYRVVLARHLADRLADAGFWWQFNILNYWIHRCQKGEFDVDVNIRLTFTRRRRDPPPREEEEGIHYV